MNFIFQDDFKNQTENNRSSRILPILPICRLATIFAVHVLFIHFHMSMINPPTIKTLRQRLKRVLKLNNVMLS